MKWNCSQSPYIVIKEKDKVSEFVVCTETTVCYNQGKENISNKGKQKRLKNTFTNYNTSSKLNSGEHVIYYSVVKSEYYRF